MKAAVVIFPGSNRDVDVIDALTVVSGREPALVWHRDTELPDADLIVLPGGFSYGDYLRSGAMAARSPILRAVTSRAEAGVAVLGSATASDLDRSRPAARGVDGKSAPEVRLP